MKIAVIGSYGILKSGMFREAKKLDRKTRFGKPSDSIWASGYGSAELFLLPRHGMNHTIPPHMINFRANMTALKELGVERIYSTTAVGSLKENYKPGDVVFPDQFIDFGKTTATVYDGPDVRHVSLADPFCPELRGILGKAADSLKCKCHKTGTYLRVSGPRFSTRAESMMFRQFADIIGMTCTPEAVLARELGMCYATIATVTDYDVWAEKPVSAEEVKSMVGMNAERTESILRKAIELTGNAGCSCSKAPEEGKF